MAAWDADSGEHKFMTRNHQGHGIAVSPDGRWLVCSERSSNIDASEVWDLTAEANAPKWRMAGKVQAARFGPQGQLVTVIHEVEFARTVILRVWDAETGRPLTPARSFDGRITRLTLSPDGKMVLILVERPEDDPNPWDFAARPYVQVLDARTGLTLTPPVRTGGTVNDVQFTPDGLGVLAVMDTGEVVRWECGPAQGDAAALADLAETWSGRTLDPSGTAVYRPLDKFPEDLTAAGRLPAASPRDPVAMAAARQAHIAALPAEPRARLELPDLNREIQASPKDATLYARRAECYEILGYFPAADADWSRAIELAPGQPRYLVRRGMNRTYYLRFPRTGEDLTRALELWDAGTADLLEAYKTGPPDRSAAYQLNERLWSVVRDPAAGAGRHRVALRLAEIARPQWTEFNTLNTLGVVRYRVGDDRGAVEALTASDKLCPHNPANLAFLAMAYHRLGEPTTAQDYLTRTRKAVTVRVFAGDPEFVEFLREAEVAVEGKATTLPVAPPPWP
jgi:tetratricopeptide (TPR) repeat protein